MEVKVLIKKIFEAAKKVTSKNAEELSQLNSVLEFSKDIVSFGLKTGSISKLTVSSN